MENIDNISYDDICKIIGRLYLDAQRVNKATEEHFSAILLEKDTYISQQEEKIRMLSNGQKV